MVGKGRDKCCYHGTGIMVKSLIIEAPLHGTGKVKLGQKFHEESRFKQF